MKSDHTRDIDAERERVAIEVMHLEPAYAQVIYNRRVAEMEKDDLPTALVEATLQAMEAENGTL